MRRTIISLLAAVVMCVSFSGCGNKQESAASQSAEEPLQCTAKISHEDEFGGVYINLTIDEFNALGFEYGDSVRIEFSNGYTLDDLPYYSGYYSGIGEALLVAYPGYPYIKAAVNFGDDLWTLGGLSENCTATVVLSDRNKYIKTQQTRDMHYKDDRGFYTSDVIFANFRNVKVGRIIPGKLYRSASPCDNVHARAKYADALMTEAGVGYILDLADNDGKIEGYISDPEFASPGFMALYRNGCVFPAAMTAAYSSDDFKEKLVGVLNAIAEHKGPYLVHCTEGKDRTGFVCIVLEALCGAGYSEIEADYMLTYDNYYGITREIDSEKYDIIVEQLLLPMLSEITGESGDPRSADLEACAVRYVLKAGISREKLDSVISALTRA